VGPLVGVPSDQITDEVWHAVRRPIRAALAHADGRYHMGDVYRALKRRDWQLWCSPRSVVVTAVEQWPRSRRMAILFAAGDLADVPAGLPILLAWGEAKGCDAAEVHGRPGWSRALGWQVVDTVARIRLCPAAAAVKQ
jgi:hypothetical protein